MVNDWQKAYEAKGVDEDAHLLVHIRRLRARADDIERQEPEYTNHDELHKAQNAINARFGGKPYLYEDEKPPAKPPEPVKKRVCR